MQALEGADGPTTLRPLYAREVPVPIVQEARWASEPVWVARKILLPPIFDSRTVQPIANRSADYAKYRVRGTSGNLCGKYAYLFLKFLIAVKSFGQSEFIDKTLTINLEQ
jgi:hypothetical protein